MELVLVQFLLLVLAFHEAVSDGITKNDAMVCVDKDEIIKYLKGRHGGVGPPGEGGDRGLCGGCGLEKKRIFGDPGFNGQDGEPGSKGSKGDRGSPGFPGLPGKDGMDNKQRGEKGDPGLRGRKGRQYYGPVGDDGATGDAGDPGTPGVQISDEVLKSLLNDFYVLESGYYDNLYHVTSRQLTDGRIDTGGWGSQSAKTRDFIQTAYFRPVYVTSVTLAGGFIPSWGHNTTEEHGFMDLEYSANGYTWEKILKLKTPFEHKMVTHHLTIPVTAKYWRLISTENKWVGTTEFTLKPLVSPYI